VSGLDAVLRRSEDAVVGRIWAGSHIELPTGATIPGLVAQAAAQHAERIALVDSLSGRTMTYGALDASVVAVASALRSRGAGGDTVLAIYAPNSIAWVVATLAVMRAGGAASGASPLLKPDELARHLRLTKARWLLTAPQLLEPAMAAAAEAGGVEVIVDGDAVEGATAFSEFFREPGCGNAMSVDPAAPAMLPFSSGTTSLPKPVVLTHRALAAAALQIHSVLGFTSEDTLLALAPFFFILGSVVVLFGGLAAGAKLVVVPRFDFETVLDNMERHHVSIGVLTPPILKLLAERSEVDRHDLSPLRLIASGGTSVPAELEERVARRLRAIVVQGYGMTETSATIAINPPASPRPGTCGKPFPLVEMRIVDPETALDKEPAETGEIWVRGPQLMTGYLGDPAATHQSFSTDGWLRTGDLGFVDADGYLHLSGRIKEMIKVNAYQVAPAELERLLASHQSVADVAVVGRPDERVGEIPVAYVVPRTKIDPEDLMNWVAVRVARYKRIRAIRFVDQIPRSPAGKILRRLLT
jgi:acyl-CoA synthetase (AMP-forming)/AMP-acid ligase II